MSFLFFDNFLHTPNEKHLDSNNKIFTKYIMWFIGSLGIFGFFVGSYWLGRYSVRKDLQENISKIQKLQKETDSDILNDLLVEHIHFLKNKI